MQQLRPLLQPRLLRPPPLQPPQLLLLQQQQPEATTEPETLSIRAWPDSTKLGWFSFFRLKRIGLRGLVGNIHDFHGFAGKDLLEFKEINFYFSLTHTQIVFVVDRCCGGVYDVRNHLSFIILALSLSSISLFLSSVSLSIICLSLYHLSLSLSIICLSLSYISLSLYQLSLLSHSYDGSATYEY